MFFDNLTKICNEQDIKITPLLKELDISTGSISRWKNGVIPNGETLIKLSKRLNCSVDYLLSIDNPEIQKETNNKVDIEQAVLNYIENFNNNSELKAINIFKDGEEQKIVKMTNEQYEEFRKRYGNFDD